MTERIVTDANGRKYITTEKAILNKNLDDDYKRITELEAQNKALLEAAKQVIAWYEAEDDHSKADFYQRLEMCRASESALRAAIALVEGKYECL